VEGFKLSTLYRAPIGIAVQPVSTQFKPMSTFYVARHLPVKCLVEVRSRSFDAHEIPAKLLDEPLLAGIKLAVQGNCFSLGSQFGAASDFCGSLANSSILGLTPVLRIRIAAIPFLSEGGEVAECLDGNHLQFPHPDGD